LFAFFFSLSWNSYPLKVNIELRHDNRILRYILLALMNDWFTH